IKNITTYVGIGTLTYQWYDVSNNPLPGKTSKDLINIKGGSYRLELRDQSQCSPYSTPYITVLETNSVNISDAIYTKPTCGLNNGQLNNVYIDNADFFQWTGPNGVITTTQSNYQNLSNLTDGTYTLYAKNTVTGCDNSRTFYLSRQAPEIFNFYPVIKATTCNLSNGSLEVVFNGTIKPTTYHWVDANGIDKGYSPNIFDLTPGDYTLMVTDKYGCPSTLGTWTVGQTPLLAFAANNNPVAYPDECDQNLGRITGVEVTGGVPPYTYKWTNETTHQHIDANTASLTGLAKGSYNLTVTDATSCAVALFTGSIVVENNMFTPNQPILTDKRICNPDRVTLSVQNKVAGTYK
ncbi:MAG: hypothetical protein EOP54_31580, partial [Sphingobacteriales bacterium]